MEVHNDMFLSHIFCCQRVRTQLGCLWDWDKCPYYHPSGSGQNEKNKFKGMMCPATKCEFLVLLWHAFASDSGFPQVKAETWTLFFFLQQTEVRSTYLVPIIGTYWVNTSGDIGDNTLPTTNHFIVVSLLHNCMNHRLVFFVLFFLKDDFDLVLCRQLHSAGPIHGEWCCIASSDQRPLFLSFSLSPTSHNATQTDSGRHPLVPDW